MALSANKKAMLQQWAKAGDIMAQEALALEKGSAGFVSLGSPAASSNVHAAIAATTSVVPVTTGITNPGTPRSLKVVFGDDWDGGDVVVEGTDQFGKTVSETFVGADNATVPGVKIFKTVTSMMHTVVGTTATYTVATDVKLGLLHDVLDTFGLGLANGVPEKVTMDTTYEAVTFATTAPDGTPRVLICNL